MADAIRPFVGFPSAPSAYDPRDQNELRRSIAVALDSVSFALGNQPITLTGDSTGSGALTIPTVLATVNANVGSFGSSTSIPSFTVNAKGLITAASGNAVIAPAGTLTGTTLAANVVTSSLTTIGTLVAGAVPASLVTAGTFGNGVGDFTAPNALYVNGIFQANGNTTLGNATSDTVVFTARVASDVDPSVTETYDLGNATFRWGVGYFTSLSVGSGGIAVDSLTATGAAVGGAAVSATTGLNIAAGTTGVSSARIAHGVAPTSPVNGDLWGVSAESLYYRNNGVTQFASWTRQAAVTDASGGVVIDAEARTALNSLLAKLRTINVIAT
mgnify:CR=1 FL=1